MKKVVLKPRKDAAVQRFHPWVFSGAIREIQGDPLDGDLVAVCNDKGEQLATGHFQNGSITVRILSFGETQAEQEFWNQKLATAFSFRKAVGLAENPSTNCYRLIHGEGDGLPGLIIDVYDRCAVMQCHSIGMHRDREKIVQALLNLFGDRLEAVYDKSHDTLPAQYAGGVSNQYLFGRSTQKQAMENGHVFLVDWEEGQKTGFFLDQRDNRALLGRYAQGKTVLNAFCYTGGFSVYALQAGALHVDSVDVSAKAIALTEQNVAINPSVAGAHAAHTEDVLRFLRQGAQTYDLMIIDPPAFAKSLQKRHNAVQGYKRLNAMAMERLQAGGILFTFSCSQVVDPPLFYNTIVAAALEAGRQARVLHQLSQPADHPVGLFHPEGGYLKGLVLYVE